MLNPELKVENLHMYKILWMLVFMLGKKIKMHIIPFQIEIIFYNSISKIFQDKIKMIPREEVKDLIHQLLKDLEIKKY